MNRRQFIRANSKALLGALLLPNLLASCDEDTLFGNIKYEGKVVIIGAGVAGLYAGYLLQSHGVDFSILEASGKAGGRVGKREGFADFPIDIGGQWLHGDFSILGDLIKTSNTPTFPDNSENLFWHEGALKESLPSDLQALFDKIPDGSEDISIEDYYYALGGTEENFYLLTANTADVGASPRNVSVKWEKEGYSLQSYGADDHKFEKTYFDFINDQIIAKVSDRIQLNTVVKTIDYSADKVVITTRNGAKIEADKVIVSVPITVLKDGDIAFTPPLPSTKTESFKQLGMEAGMKAFMRFSEKFTEEGVLGGKVCASYVVESYNRNSNDLVLFGFAMGDQAKALSDIGNAAALKALLAELDEMFDGAASASYIGHSFEDWYKHPFIRGAYSYPLVGATADTRKNLAEPVDNKLFFAGEATNYNGHHQTVHGAIETGYREVINLLNTIK